ncbi:protein PRRC2C-like isoform X3 [Planococcus citri]|uniref:protein PRRC2C-like isoform X3 n=1 Tax=Planococcus citri TaxID=170843 RepID=UPI0031F7FCCE
MSTLSGNATKGEKGKKFQQLKILLPSGSKSAEPEQQPNKSSAQRIQHGMTSLGKVPTARRPTNLPSEKSEQSGNDPSVNLVPSGGPGWGNKTNETGPTPTPSLVQNANPPPSAPVNNTPMPGTSQPVQHVQHYPPASRMPPMPSQVGHVPVHHGHPDAKTWARMTLGGDTSANNPFTPQSPLFHTEFPSLSSNAEASTASTTHATATVAQKPTTNTVADTQYGPGPSLRPQTVSWMSGSRPQGAMGPQAGNPIASAPAQVRPGFPSHIGPDGARNNLAPSGVGVVPAGPYHPSVMTDKIPQYGALMPPFMLRNAYPGGFPPPGVGPRPPYGPPYMPGQHAPAERFMQPPTVGANSAKRPYDDEDTKIRSIIKEEDLNQMANIGNDIGWAGHEDIDYNQKLKFSDDEDDDKGKDGRSGKSRSKAQQAAKLAAEKAAAKKESDKENEFRTSMESLKEREKMFPAAAVENRPLEMRNVWQARKTMVAATAAPRYQITAPAGPAPGAGRFGEDDEELQERRKQKKDEMEIIIQRARERKEEVEKQYQQQLQQAAHLKLKQLDERIMAEQQRKMEIKDPHYNDRDVEMISEWEKEKARSQNRLNEAQSIEDAKKSQTATLVPVVKDASEFRALTQLGDRSTFAKKEKEPSTAAPGANYSRSFPTNVPPRFQNLNRQSSSNSTTNSAPAPPQGPSDARKNSLSQFSNKSISPSNFGPARHGRLDSDSMSDKEDTRKERYISDERQPERYQRDNVHNRDYNYDRDDDQRKYESDLKKKFYEKGDYAADSGRDFDRETNYGGKFERKNSESDRSDKSKDYMNRRYSETESHDKEPVMSWRHEESPEKTRHFNAPPRSPRTYSETEHRERKKSREEGNYEKLSFNAADKERDYYRKDLSSRDRHVEPEREKEHDHHRDSFDYKSIENDVKRERETDKKEKDSERKSPATYDDRLRESRYSRESRDSLRDESRYTIQEERSYSWVDEGEVEEKPTLRRDHHYREERGDRYSHAQRHPPGPITREKLEAKELEDSKRNLTALVRSDKKTEIKKSEPEEKKEKDKQENQTKSESTLEPLSRSQKREEPVKSAWHKDDKKDKDEAKSTATSADTGADKKDSKDKDTKSSAKSASSKQTGDESSTAKGASGGTDEKRDRRDDRKKNDRDRLPKREPRGNNWARHPVYRGNPYGGGRTESKLHRSSRTSGSGGKTSSRRDSKYSESDYSDEISGSGREDRVSRNDRDDRAVKSKRYDRDDRNMDYRVDNRDYMGGNRGGGRNRDYYSYKPSHRGRGGFRAAVGVGKRMDGYGPPPSKSPFGNSGSYGDERRHKSKDIDGHGHGHDQHSDKKDYSHADKGNADGKHSSAANSRQQNSEDKSNKKNDSAQDNKSTVSSPTSVQTAEANEESFATASEGTDSEDNGLVAKSKPAYTGTKRQSTVVATKPQRANYRSTSRKRFEGRRTAPLYSRKESGSYGTTKRNSTSSGGGGKSSSGGNKENEKYAAEATADGGFGKAEQENKSGSNEKSRREYSDNQSSSASAAKKNVKSRNRSNSRKNVRSSGAMTNSRSKNQEVPAQRMSQTKQRKNYDSKPPSEYRESKLDIPMPLFKELGPPIPAPPPTTNAWDKPITGALRTGSPSTNVPSAAASANAAAVAAAAAAAANAASVSSSVANSSGPTSIGHDKGSLQGADHHIDSSRSDINSGVGSSGGLGVDKVTTKVLENLDGSTPPVQTIIFENTNFKSAPGDKTKYTNQLKNHRYDKDMNLNANDCVGVSNFNTDSSSSELPSKHNPLMTLSYKVNFIPNEDVSDMKLDFTFDSEFSKLTDDNKSAAKSMELHAMQLGQSTDAELNRKIAQVKKVWDGSLVESYDDVMVNTSSTSFSPSFSSHSSDPNSTCFVNTHVDSSEHLQVDDVGMAHNEVVFSPVSQIQGVNSSYGSVTNCQTVVIKNDATSSSSNVCKVKPQPQGCSTNMANVAAQSTVMSATLVSQPPPMSSPSYTFSCSTPQPALNSNAVAATALAQINFQAAAAQYGSMPPVPSSPVLYNSTQPAAPGPTALYGAFQIDNPQVAARTQFNQFAAASYGLSGAVGQTSAFNQSVFVQQPPPSAPPPEMYSSAMPPYRLQPQAFGNTQQITSPSTVLISSTSNSLMSATIKPSNQQISAIGTKTGYPTAQTSPLYIPLDPATQLLNQNFMPGSQLLQRPASNVIPAGSLQAASTSFYTTGSGAGVAGQTGYFPTGTNSPLQPQPGTAIGLSYNAQSAAPSLGPTAMQNFGSQLTQQFRSAPSYLKSSANACNIGSDFGNGKPITLSNQHDALNSVFPPVGCYVGTQMSSTKPRIPTGGKNVVQNVQQAMGQHNMSQNSYSYQSANQMRNNGGANKGSQYPHPIQRPVSQGNANSSNRAGNSTSNSSSHRMPVRNNAHQLVNNIQQQPPSSVYYTPSSGYSTSSTKLEASSLDSKSEPNSDSKLADSIKTINSKNVTVSSSEKTAVTNE